MRIQECIIVEDDIFMARQLQLILQEEGYRAQIYHSAEEFIFGAKISEVSPVFFFLDMNLPGLKGNQIVELIRHKDKLSPIFVVSGEREEEKIASCLLSGADDFISKPYSASVLMMKVRNIQTKYRLLSEADLGITLIPEGLVLSVYGNKTKLTPTEYRIVEILLTDLGAIHDLHGALEHSEAGRGPGGALSVHVSSLRKKLEPLQLEIVTARGRGYRLEKRSLELKAR